MAPRATPFPRGATGGTDGPVTRKATVMADTTPVPAEPSGPLETVTNPTVADILASGRLADEDAVAQAVQARIAARIFAAAEAGDWDAVTTPPAPVGLRTLVGHELTFRSVEWMRSNIAGSAGVYCIAEVADNTTGEELLVTTGAGAVMAQLRAYEVHGKLPVRLVPVFERTTGRGFQPMSLRLPQPVKAASR